MNKQEFLISKENLAFLEIFKGPQSKSYVLLFVPTYKIMIEIVHSIVI